MGRTCPNCHSPVDVNATLCPQCQTSLPAVTGALELAAAQFDVPARPSAEPELRPLAAPEILLPDEPSLKLTKVDEAIVPPEARESQPLVLAATAAEPEPPAEYVICAEFRLPDEEECPLMPLAAQLGPEASLHVLDAGRPDAFRWVQFSPAGEVLRLHLLARGPSGLQAPVGIALDHEGQLYIADFGAGRVSRCSAAGVLSSMASLPTLAGPADVELDEDNNLLIAEAQASRVTKYDRQGRALWSYGKPDRPLPPDEEDEEEEEEAPQPATSEGPLPADWLSNPSGVAAQRHGDIYLADTNHHRVLKLAAAGQYIGDAALGVELLYPSNLKVQDSGQLFVADLDGSRIHKFDTTGRHLYTVIFESDLVSGEFDVDQEDVLYLPSRSRRAVLKVKYAR